MKKLKCIIAIVASAFASLNILGIGLVGTGSQPLWHPLLLVLGISLTAGVVIALLPKTQLRPVLIAASFPAGILAYLMIMGFMEKRNIVALYWLGMPIGIVALIMLPSVARALCVKRKSVLAGTDREMTDEKGNE